jgi:hypothetical protein
MANPYQIFRSGTSGANYAVPTDDPNVYRLVAGIVISEATLGDGVFWGEEMVRQGHAPNGIWIRLDYSYAGYFYNTQNDVLSSTNSFVETGVSKPVVSVTGHSLGTNNSIEEGGQVTFFIERFDTQGNPDVFDSLRLEFRFIGNGATGDDLDANWPIGSKSPWNSGTLTSDDNLADLVFLEGSSIAEVRIFTKNDSLIESSEQIGIQIQPLSTYSIQTAELTVSIIDNDSASPTYSVSSSSSSVNEGSSALFTVATTNVASGTNLSYSLYGVSASDVTSGSLSGTTTVGSNGQASISIPITADNLTEGTETLTVTVQGQTASVTINDTSRSPVNTTPTYSIVSSASSVAEGSSAVFTLSTTNVTPGSGVSYTIGGLGASDIVGGELTGSVVVGSDGTARISVPLFPDQLTEGTETLYVTVSNQTASMTVLDTSVSQVSNSTTNNTTNITNNNITNNTTNNNSNNTTTNITNNVNVTFQNSILNYDASVTNDSSVRQVVMGNVNQFEGSTINNIIVGTAGADRLFGYEGNDRFLSTAGNDVFDGGDGLDAITFEGSWRDFVLSGSGSNWTVRDTSSSGTNEGTDTLTGVERLGFADKAVALDIDGNAGKAYRVYKAAFARDPM